MRFVSYVCLLLIGLPTSQGLAQQITSNPSFGGQPKTSVPTRGLPSPYPIADGPALQKPLAENQSEDLNGFNNAFENALSQFAQPRIAKLPEPMLPEPTQPAPALPKPIQEGAPILESPRTTVESNSAKEELWKAVVPQQLSEPNEFPSTTEHDFPGASGAILNTTDNGFEPLPTQGTGTVIETVPDVAQWEVPQTNATVTPEMLNSMPGTIGGATIQNAAMSMYQGVGLPDADVITWWKGVVNQPLDGSRPTEPVDSNTLVYRAIQNSPRIQAVSQNPLIRELQIIEADAEFDAVRYLRSQFEDRVDPVGNELTVGNGESFLKDNIWTADAGFRRKARNGANWELNQRLGFQNSNSNFFVPQDQGTATLALNVTQPLLRGRGVYYNQSQILIAQATNGAAWRTFQAELQDELLGVMSAYWDLYLTRSIFLQKQRNVERGVKILERLEGRSQLDSLPSQIARARSSVQTRRTELANAIRDVLNAETEVRRRIADTSWMQQGASELIPGELPSASTFDVPLEQVVYNALQYRPEIHEVLNRVRVATVQRDVSANELLPELSLLMGTYVSALRGDTGLLNAFQDQFGQVTPGYSVGINFELPYGNRAAKSRFAQRQLQVRKISAEVEEVIQNVIAESQVALRRLHSASETLIAASEAIRAARSDREQFERRWESFGLVAGDLAEGQNPTTVLDQLLDSQDRLASAELVFVQAERELKVAEVSLQRAMGTLLMAQSVTATRGYDRKLPRMNISRLGYPGVEGVVEIPVTVPQMQETQWVSPTGYTQQQR